MMRHGAFPALTNLSLPMPYPAEGWPSQLEDPNQGWVHVSGYFKEGAPEDWPPSGHPGSRPLTPACPVRAASRDLSATSPALTIKFSGPSFLDTLIRDSITKDPLYIIETTRDLTHVYRLDVSRREAGKAASMQWPRTVLASGEPCRAYLCHSLRLARAHVAQIEDVHSASLPAPVQVEANTGSQDLQPLRVESQATIDQLCMHGSSDDG